VAPYDTVGAIGFPCCHTLADGMAERPIRFGVCPVLATVRVWVFLNTTPGGALESPGTAQRAPSRKAKAIFQLHFGPIPPSM